MKQQYQMKPHHVQRTYQMIITGTQLMTQTADPPMIYPVIKLLQAKNTKHSLEAQQSRKEITVHKHSNITHSAIKIT